MNEFSPSTPGRAPAAATRIARLTLALAALVGSTGGVRAQDTTKTLPASARTAAPIRRVDQIPTRADFRYDTLQWQRAEPAAVETATRFQGSVFVPPEELRVARELRRADVLTLEAPLFVVTTRERVYNLSLSVDPRPGLACSARGCAGTVQLSVVDSAQPVDEIPLPFTVAVDLFGVDSVAPSHLEVGSTRRLHSVHVYSRMAEATLVAQPVGFESVQVPLPVRKPQIRMEAAATSMDAWGLETIKLNVLPVQGLDPDDTLDVLLRGDGLRVEPSHVRVSSTSGDSAVLRSRALGRGVVTAQGPPYVEGAEAVVRMRPPWMFLLFALVGGLAGAVIAEQRRGWPDTGAAVVRQLGADALFGVILAVLTALPDRPRRESGRLPAAHRHRLGGRRFRRGRVLRAPGRLVVPVPVIARASVPWSRPRHSPTGPSGP
jgi:hypothetical protein